MEQSLEFGIRLLQSCKVLFKDQYINGILKIVHKDQVFDHFELVDCLNTMYLAFEYVDLFKKTYEDTFAASIENNDIVETIHSPPSPLPPPHPPF